MVSAAVEPVAGSPPSKKNRVKAPNKIHKAEREKLKRDQLNELFQELGHALEPTRQNSGKASILDDATRILRDIILQVESLRKENVALVTEFHYVTVEKDELQEENMALIAEVVRLQDELRERLQSDPMQNATDPTALATQATNAASPVVQPPLAPFYMFPLRQDLQPLPEAAVAPSPPKPTTQVRRPHARYPTPSDSWPLEVLSRHQRSGSSSSDSLEKA